MNEIIFNDIKTKKALIKIVDKQGESVWESSQSPASTLYNAYFEGKFQNMEGLSVYANQAGLAVAIIAEKMQIKNCYAYRMSECGMKKFKEHGVDVWYEEMIPLVMSSKDENQVCPIELFLTEHDNSKEQWDFLEQRFKNTAGEHTSCSIAAHRP